MNRFHRDESDEFLNTKSKTPQKKPNGIVCFDDEGVMWYREVHETELSEPNEMITGCYSGLTLMLDRASHLAR